MKGKSDEEKMSVGLEEKRMKSVEISRFFDIIKDIFLLLGYLHFSLSSSQSLSNQVLRLSI